MFRRRWSVISRTSSWWPCFYYAIFSFYKVYNKRNYFCYFVIENEIFDRRLLYMYYIFAFIMVDLYHVNKAVCKSSQVILIKRYYTSLVLSLIAWLPTKNKRGQWVNRSWPIILTYYYIVVANITLIVGMKTNYYS